MEGAEMERICGEVDSVVYKNDDTGFAVVMIKYDGDLVCAVGEMGAVEEGEELTCTGSFVVHQKFGEQFKCELCEHSLPKSADAIERYLSSGIVKGIGPTTAGRIVEKFGEQTFEILENEPERLCEVSGITHDKAEKMSVQFRKNFAVRTLISFLSGYSIPMSTAISAFKKWGEHSDEVLHSNPYLLCAPPLDVAFTKADDMAQDFVISKESEHRIRAGISYILRQNAQSGHTCLPMDKLQSIALDFLQIDEWLFDKTVSDELEDQNLYCYLKNGRKFIMLADFFCAEDYISRRLLMMKECSYDNKIDFSQIINTAEKSNGIEYDERQREAINLSLSYGFLIITGGPGTGKTTTLNAIIDAYKQQSMTVMVAAPTGRAAKRLSEVTGCEAKTIHRLLEVKPADNGVMSFVHNEENMLECDALIIDEMSMVDTLLFEAVLRAIKLTCKLVLVGDSDQLPSVGAGNVLKDIMDSGVMPVVKLTEIFRQSRQSSIVMNAHKIVKGEHIDLAQRDNDFFFMQRLDFGGLQKLIAELCKTRLPNAYGYSPFDDIQVMSPTRQGPAGTVELNKILQQQLNPPAKSKSEIKTPLFTYRTGDKVMQTKNDYDIIWKRHSISGKKSESGTGIFNGDIGRITSCNKILRQLTIDFDGRTAVYTADMLDNLSLAYAITVHKSQGSEYDAVILAVFGGYDKLYYRNLLYTAVTRARKLLVIVGQDKRVNFMIDNDRRVLRYTCLKNMLNEQESGEELETDISIL